MTSASLNAQRNASPELNRRVVGFVRAPTAARSSSRCPSQRFRARSASRTPGRPHAHVDLARGHPQDPPRRRDHAGEPLVRLLLRHVPGRRRNPSAERQVHGLRRPTRGRRCACVLTTTRSTGTRRARTSIWTRSGTSTAGRWTGSSARPGAGWSPAARRTRTRRSARWGPTTPDVMGYHDWHEIPNYWDYARHFVLHGPHVRAGHLVEPAGPPVHGLGVVGPLPRARRPDELRRTRSRTRSLRRTRRRTRRTRSRTTRGPTSPTCCTRTMSPGATTCSRAPSRTATTTGWSARRSGRARRRLGSGTRCPGSTRSSRTTSSRTSSR